MGWTGWAMLEREQLWRVLAISSEILLVYLKRVWREVAITK